MKTSKGWSLRGFREFFVVGFLSLLVSLILQTYVFSFVRVKGESMSPTYHSGDLKIIGKLGKNYSKGDVILFKRGSKVLIKRVIGVGGDTLSVRNGVLVLNGSQMIEPWFNGKMDSDFGEVRIPNGKLFVMGDNRNNSKDSRYEDVGMVGTDEVLGTLLNDKFN